MIAPKEDEVPAWIESGEANLIFGSCILINAFVIGIETDKRNPYLESQLGWDIVEWMFLVVFTIEMLMRFYHWGKRYFCDGWNIFDFVLVSSGYFSVVIANIESQNEDGEQTSYAGIFTTLRTVRLLRLFRVLRLFRFFRELWILAQGIIQATRALGWVFVLLFIVLFICAIFMTRILGQNEKTEAVVALGCNYLDDEGSMSEECLIDEWFGHVLKSMFTLFTVMTLEGWPDVARVCMQMTDNGGGPGMAIFFVIFIMTVNITLLNLVTGIIVENVLTISRQDELEKLSMQQKERQNRLQTLEQVFRLADTDESGDVSRQEFETSITQKEVIAQLMSIDITVLDAEDLFQILDVDGSGSISLTEFIEGFSRVKGPALAKHLLKLHYDLQKQMKLLGRDVQMLAEAGAESEDQIRRRVAELEKRIKALISHKKKGQSPPPPEVTSQGEDEEKTLARELAHHYAAILGIMDRFRELQSVKGTAAPVPTPMTSGILGGGATPDLLHTIRGLCAKSDKLLSALTAKNLLSPSNPGNSSHTWDPGQ